MASLQELKTLFGDSDLEDKVFSALIISVQVTLENTPTADEVRYAAHVFSNLNSEGSKAIMSVLASNRANTLAQILNAPDSSVQEAVDAVMPTLLAAYVAGA